MKIHDIVAGAAEAVLAELLVPSAAKELAQRIAARSTQAVVAGLTGAPAPAKSRVPKPAKPPQATTRRRRKAPASAAATTAATPVAETAPSTSNGVHPEALNADGQSDPLGLNKS